MSEQEKQFEMEAEAVETEVTETVEEVKGTKPAKTAKGSAKPAKKKVGFFGRIARWFREMKSELKKVQWPTWKQTMNNTLIVIICVIIVGIFIWAFDWLARLIVNALLALAGKA